MPRPRVKKFVYDLTATTINGSGPSIELKPLTTMKLFFDVFKKRLADDLIKKPITNLTLKVKITPYDHTRFCCDTHTTVNERYVAFSLTVGKRQFLKMPIGRRDG